MSGKYRYLLMMVLLQACSTDYVQTDAAGPVQLGSNPVKNIILMIGDGMGPVHRQVADLLSDSGMAVMDQLPERGELRTASYNGALTDSAAAATAMATGHKTRNKVIGLDAELNYLPNIVEAAQQQSIATGLVTTTQISHATPAGFSAHVSSRKNMLEIARQQMLANIDVLMGGGESYLLTDSQSGCFPQPGKRQDGLDLIAMAKASGYQYVCNRADLLALDTAYSQRLLGIFADEGMQRPFSPGLALMTRKAIEILSHQDAGFFLMVEGGQIDWASHANNGVDMMDSVQGFDAAVKVARDFVAGRDDTLLIVTADHETGGLSLHSDEGEQGPFLSAAGVPFYLSWSSSHHTPVDVPVSAMGPGAPLLQGTHDNTFIYQLMLAIVNNQQAQ